MKHSILFLLLILPLLTISAQDTPPLSDTLLDAKIERLIKLSGAEIQFGAAIDQIIAMHQGNPLFKEVLPDIFWDEFAAEAHKEGYQRLLPNMMSIYKAQLTEAEIDHQIAYLNDPMTQGIIAKQPAIMQAAMSIGQQWGQEMGAQIAEKLQRAVEKRN
jgi:hypothetical protein